MSTNPLIRSFLILALPAFCGVACAQTLIDSARPVADAALKLEQLYGWPITYEDPPYVYAGDLEDATSRVRRDGKSAKEPGVAQILLPRSHSFMLNLEASARPAMGTRAPETAARAAILAMLKSYSESIGGVQMFSLTEADGLFHIVPTQRRDKSGQWEKIVPLFDSPVSLSGGLGDVIEIVTQVCRSLRPQPGERVDLFTTWQPARSYIEPKPGESARSILSRLMAEQNFPLPVSWAVFYQPGWGYMLNLHRVNTQDYR